MDVNQQGCFAEYKFVTECMKRGLNISMPVLHSSIYDCIVDTGKNLVKVQVKSTKKQPLLIEPKTNRKQNNVQINIENNKKPYLKKYVDFFAVWVEIYDGFFIFRNTGNIHTIRLSLVGKHSNKFNNFVFD